MHSSILVSISATMGGCCGRSILDVDSNDGRSTRSGSHFILKLSGISLDFPSSPKLAFLGVEVLSVVELPFC